MSFILDALKKAEEEKNAGKPPEPIAVIAAPAARPAPRRVQQDAQRRLLLIAAGSVLLVLMVALTLWLLPRRSTVPAAPPAVAAAAPTAEAIEAAPQAEAAATTAEEPVFLEAPDPTASPEDAGAEAASLDDLVGDESEPVEDTPPAPEEPAVATEDELSEEAIAALSQPAKPASKKPREVPAGVKRLRDMPPAFRTQFPQLNMDVHYYDEDNPLKRFVIINGRKYRETDTLVEGPKVVEITVGGVILDQAGTRVVRGIPR